MISHYCTTPLAYVNSSGNYVYITAAQANTAFNAAQAKVGIANTTTLDLSNVSQGVQIFSVLENAISVLLCHNIDI